jgi:hypothetical protein
MARLRCAGLAILAVAVLACTEAPTHPESVETELLSVSSDYTNGPPSAGVVVRTPLNTFGLWVNGDGSLVAVHGMGSLDPNDSPVCGGASNFDVISFQHVVNSKGAIHELARNKGGTWHVWADAGTFFSQPTLCDSFNLPRVAEGYGQVIGFDNDLDVSGTRTNTYGFRGRGTLSDLVNGGTTRFTLLFQELIEKDGTVRTIWQEITLD